MEKPLLTVAIGLTVLSLAAQDPYRDSLEAVLDTARADSTIVKARVALCMEYRYAGDTTYLGFIDSTITMAHQADMPALEAKAHYERGLFHDRRGYPEEALRNYRAGKLIAEEHGLMRETGYGLFFIAGVQRYRSEHEAALATYGDAIDIFEELGMPMQLATLKFSQGVVLDHLGRFEESIQKFYDALAEYEELGDEYGIGLTYNSLGLMHERAGRPDEALVLYHTARMHMAKGGSREEMANILGNLGNAHRHRGDHDSAIYYVDASLAERRAIGDVRGEATGLMQLSEDLLVLEQPAEAAKVASRARALFAQLGDRQAESRALTRLARGRAELGAWPEAFRAADSALVLAHRTASLNEEKAAEALLAELHEQRGNAAEALAHYKAYTALKDSILDRESLATLEELRTRYETERKDRQLAEQELAMAEGRALLERRRKWNLGLGLGAGALLAIALLLWRNKRNADRLSAEKLERIQREREIDTIKAVLEGEERERQRVARELHDGIGVLLSSALMHQRSDGNGEGTSSDLLEEACTEVRRISHAMMPGSLVRFGLPEALDELARQTGAGGDLQVRVSQFGMKQRLPEPIEVNLYRIAQEALNNALKYSGASTVEIELSREDDQVQLVIADDGRGLDPGLGQEGNGLGNIRSRAALIGGRAEVRSTPGQGVVWEVEVPLPVLT